MGAAAFTAALAPALASVLALALAVAWDRCLGEPRDAWHPVAWFGRALRPVGTWLRGFGAGPAFVGGALTWLACALLFGALAWTLETHARHWPMAAMALRLGVRLRKPGVYALNRNGRTPDNADLVSALNVAMRAAWAGIALAMLACLVRELLA